MLLKQDGVRVGRPLGTDLFYLSELKGAKRKEYRIVAYESRRWGQYCLAVLGLGGETGSSYLG